MTTFETFMKHLVSILAYHITTFSSMLPRTAARIARDRIALSAFRAPQPQWVRQYARRAPPKPQDSSRSTIETDEIPQGPVKNRTWSPDKGIRFSAPASTPGQQGNVLEDEFLAATPEYAKDPIKDIKSDILPQSNAPAQQAANSQVDDATVIAQPPPTSAPKAAPSSEAKLRDASEPAPASTESSSEPPSTGPLPDLRQGLPSSGLFTNKTSDAALEANPAQEPQTTGPLPDLRQGIPSAFGQDPADKTDAASSSSLNLTEDPAGAGGRGGGGDDAARQQREYVSSIERRRNAFARYAYTAFGAFALAGSLLLGQNWDEEEAKLHPDAPNGWAPTAIYARIKSRIGGQLGYYTEPAFQKLLPDMDPNMRAPYTLVLSLEDLLVSSKWDRNKGWQVAKRPGVDYFLRYLSQYYELVIFTSVSSVNADMVVRKLDPFRIVSWPLFREPTRYQDGEHVKVTFIT